MLSIKLTKSIFASSIGNILEWYDFGLFAIYAPLFSRIFFPSSDSHSALVMTFSILAVGFLCRPFGALLFGYLGDRRGRALTLRLSILMISIPTLLIGLMPTYTSVGLLAPILLTLIRMWQGISLGGEYSGNLIYLVESSPVKHRAMITSFAATGANIGIMLASCVSAATSYFFSDALFQAYGWRLPYLLSGLFSLFIYFRRLQLKETPVFIEEQKKQQIPDNPIAFVAKNDLGKVFVVMGLACMGSTFYYLCFIYMPTYLMQNLQFSLTQASALMTVFIASMIVLVPSAGWLADHIPRRKMLLFNTGLIALITVPCFYFLLDDAIWIVLLVLGVLTLASSLEQATTCVAVVENFPPPARYTGVSVGYNISNAIFGGTAPLVCQLLIDKTHIVLAPAIYIVLCAILTGIVVFFFTKKGASPV